MPVLAHLTASLVLAIAMAGPAVTETHHLKVETSAQPAAAAPGAHVTLTIAVTPKPTMHVYAPGQDGFIPISVTVDKSSAYTAAPATYPKGEKKLFPALNETQLVYSQPFRITQQLTLARSATSPVTVKGTVRYQACDDKVCYRPVSVPVTWTIEVASRQ